MNMTKQKKLKAQDRPGAVPQEPAASRSLYVWKGVAKALVLPILAAAYSRVSLLALAPVYGSTPAHMYHDILCTIAICAGSFFMPEVLRKTGCILPALALSIPIAQSFLLQQSSLFGNPAGPVLTELLTIFPLLLLSMSSCVGLVNPRKYRQGYPAFTEIMTILYGVVVFRLADTAIQSFLPAHIGTNALMTTFGMQTVIALLYAAIVSSYLSWGLVILPAAYLFVTADRNIPFVYAATRVNSVLHGVGYSLVERQESLTGYISVIDNVELGFRAMRCDHSLLGGEWTRRPSHYNPRVSDPIYAVFTMLEAVRLVESDPELPKKEDKDSNALVMYENFIRY